MENVWKITVILRFLLSIFQTTSDWHMRLKDACPPSSRIQKPTLHEIRGLIIELTDPKCKLTKIGQNQAKTGRYGEKIVPAENRALFGILRNRVRN